MIEVEAAPLRVLVIHPVHGAGGGKVSKLDLQEAVSLAEALGVEVPASEIVTVRDIKAGNYFGSGKVGDMAALINQHDIGLVVVNTSLAPIQQRNLEDLWNAKVVDRTGLILEIFSLRAATKEGRLQVELARLAYERSRLVRTWTHLERQRGGQGFLAGPGETQIESDRRMLADKISKLRRDLDQVRRTRALQRNKRKRAPERVAALVGYTNAGKSTLFNALTGSKIFVKDMLFATLDTTHRVLELPSGQKAVLSDTVGFISDLPTDLVDAFRATLEEVKEADLLIHVRDISDPLSEARKQNVLDILASIEAGPKFDQDIIEVWNKTDLLPDDDAAHDSLRAGRAADNELGQCAAYALSCITGKGLENLREGIEAHLSANDHIIKVTIGPKDFAIRAWLFEHGDVIEEAITNKGEYAMEVRLSQIELGILRARHQHIFL